MLAAGDLDRKIVVQRQGAGFDDGFTTQPGDWQDYVTAWASWKRSNGREVIQAQGRDALASGTFWMRYSAKAATIRATDSVMFANRRWQVVGVQELGRAEGIELLVVSDEDDA